MSALSAHPKLVLVTGGHRRLGAAIAVSFARAGYRLALHNGHSTELEQPLVQALAQYGTQWASFRADFHDLNAAEQLVTRIRDHFGEGPDILVNNAAVFGQDRLHDVTAHSLMLHYAVNCAAPTLLTKALVALPPKPGRCIINILDQRIDNPHGDQLAYTLSKLALAGLTQITARELAPQIRVNAVAPGLTIATSDYSDHQLARLPSAMPLACLPTPEQVADAVLYLAGATAVTGQVLYIDGGAHLRSYESDFAHLDMTKS